jgi:hypothetical protein
VTREFLLGEEGFAGERMVTEVARCSPRGSEPHVSGGGGRLERTATFLGLRSHCSCLTCFLLVVTHQGWVLRSRQFGAFVGRKEV